MARGKMTEIKGLSRNMLVALLHTAEHSSMCKTPHYSQLFL